MATPISKTVGQLFIYSHGASCKEVYDLLDSLYPGWTEDTVIDALTWCEQARTAGAANNINFGILHGLTSPMQAQFINWAIAQIISYVPNGYSRKAAMITLQGKISDYLSAPTAGKKATLLSIAKAIKPDTTNATEMCVANIFKSVAAEVALGIISGRSLYELATQLRVAADLLGGIPRATTDGTILTQLETIIGVI
jgi:hypothetical protein